MVIDFVQGGELFEFVALGGLPERICRFIFNQILQGLYYLHSKGIAHLDMKSENLLVDPHDYTIKICDFGLA